VVKTLNGQQVNYLLCKLILVAAIDRGTKTLASLADVIKEVATAKTSSDDLFEEVEKSSRF
jgi:hypothetical protein